ncbi:hypothetical protein ACIRRA_12955 [Nocardia sp. NPDC101769]|uniref:hypothetical protein n=1 Tax=Nocardia sp. NPDC101769 TaxID=3364333 RepID=UPI0037FB0553
MSGNEVDEVARNWPQLAALIFQLLQRIQRASADGSVRLSRADYKQFTTELRDAQKVLTHEISTTRAWYQNRTEDYQRESHAAGTRASVGASAEEQAKATGYLSGLRASIEHTIHDTVLTAEQRGQVVQTLDGIDNDPSKPVARNVFEPVSGVAAVRARLAAAVSEQQVTQHRERLTQNATAAAEQPASAEIAALRQDNARRFDDLAGRLEHLEDRVNQLRPQQTATAAAATNGHGVPRENHKARTRAAQRPEQHAEAQQSNGASVHPEAAAHAEAEQEHPAPQTAAGQPQHAATHVESAAQMQAEA